MLLSSGVFVTSCSSSEKEAQSEEKCTYSYNNESSIMEWTAFKFTERKGVKGSFNQININGIENAESPKKLIESLGFNIDTKSVETNDPGRNEKIATYFFGSIGTEVLTGRFTTITDDGKAQLEITMNGITKAIWGTYELNDTNFSFHGSIDVMDWAAGEGLSQLNGVCIENHTGPDGVLKLWSEVDLSFTTQLVKTCE